MFQPDLLKSKRIFLTGGGSGLGRSMALHFAALGAQIFIIGRRPEPLKSVCEEIQQAGGTAAYATCDVRDYAAVEAAADTAETANSAASTQSSTTPPAISWRAPKNSPPTPSTPSSASSSTARSTAPKLSASAGSQKSNPATSSTSSPLTPPQIAAPVSSCPPPALKPASSP